MVIKPASLAGMNAILAEADRAEFEFCGATNDTQAVPCVMVIGALYGVMRFKG
jgi:hypothetical protein